MSGVMGAVILKAPLAKDLEWLAGLVAADTCRVQYKQKDGTVREGRSIRDTIYGYQCSAVNHVIDGISVGLVSQVFTEQSKAQKLKIGLRRYGGLKKDASLEEYPEIEELMSLHGLQVWDASKAIFPEAPKELI